MNEVTGVPCAVSIDKRPEGKNGREHSVLGEKQYLKVNEMR